MAPGRFLVSSPGDLIKHHNIKKVCRTGRMNQSIFASKISSSVILQRTTLGNERRNGTRNNRLTMSLVWKIIYRDVGIGSYLRTMRGAGQVLTCVTALQPYPVIIRKVMMLLYTFEVFLYSQVLVSLFFKAIPARMNSFFFLTISELIFLVQIW